ncbi:hypothetical protein PVAND_006543 [Polypedilum vanderplanki]|uniref:C2H2-type domain-containing protein n=1 Tax=Polypedilum vanderplanki TaxID=319348 RepID=A0A9J6C575_POLVA|nr:hypothetical protein PVAND_006543 [Polypedilum vanderplanki]
MSTIESFCKFCAKSCDNDNSNYLISDSLIKDFIRKISIVINIESEANYVCCSSCFSKIKFFVKFLSSIENAQKMLDNKFSILQKDPLVDDVKIEATEQPIINSKYASNDVNEEENFLDEYHPKEQSEDELWHKKKSKISPKKKIKRFHNDFRCAKCKRSHSSYGDLELHILLCYQNPQQYSCIICHKYFDTTKGLAIHMTTLHNDDESDKSNTIDLFDKTVKRIKK